MFLCYCCHTGVAWSNWRIIVCSLHSCDQEVVSVAIAAAEVMLGKKSPWKHTHGKCHQGHPWIGCGHILGNGRGALVFKSILIRSLCGILIGSICGLLCGSIGGSLCCLLRCAYFINGRCCLAET